MGKAHNVWFTHDNYLLKALREGELLCVLGNQEKFLERRHS